MPNLRWIKVGPDPLHYALAEGELITTGQPFNAVGKVQKERSGWYRWETYANPHEHGSKPSLEEAQAEVERRVGSSV